MSTSTEAPATDDSVSAGSADSADSADSAGSPIPGAFLGRIYRISAPSFGDRVYVGSTRKTLSARLLKHQRNRRQWERGMYHYVSSFELVGRPDVEIDLIEEDEYPDQQHQRDREAYWISRLPSVNRHTPGRSDAESHRVSSAARVPCGTCGKIVRRSEHWNHQRSRACMLAAFNRGVTTSGS